MANSILTIFELVLTRKGVDKKGIFLHTCSVGLQMCHTSGQGLQHGYAGFV